MVGHSLRVAVICLQSVPIRWRWRLPACSFLRSPLFVYINSFFVCSELYVGWLAGWAPACLLRLDVSMKKFWHIPMFSPSCSIYCHERTGTRVHFLASVIRYSNCFYSINLIYLLCSPGPTAKSTWQGWPNYPSVYCDNTDSTLIHSTVVD